jgi:chromate reductase, NAD(P)H dehydrogenase (quinone)
MAKRVAVIVGSLRKQAFSGKTARAACELAPESLQLEILEIGQLPLYNQDYDDGGEPPPEYTAFRDRLKSFDAVLFVTPEHNRSMPAALKNAIDVGSRPYGHNVWDGKPGAVISVAPGSIGAFGANHHLRQSLVFVNVPAMAQPEAYIGEIDKAFDSAGSLVDASVADFIRDVLAAFGGWVEGHRSG